jgi:DeoR/GlpR family transcriptional regulator of sugar metabolism
MLPAERLERILSYINDNGFVTVNELLEIFDVSKPTIMRDLAKLERQEMINRSHGGATSVQVGTKFEPTHLMKEKQEVDKKKKIALMAKQFISPNETILLDSGSTTLMLAEQLLSMKNLTVITNDLKIAMCLSENEDIELVVLGGQKRKGVYSLIGSIPENLIVNLCVDKAFLGVDAIDLKKGMTNANLDEMNLKKLMIGISQKTILLVDSTKFNHAAFAKIGDIELIDHIITDDQLTDEEIISELKERKVKLHIAT